MGTRGIWNGEIRCNWAPILKCHRKIWYKFPDCGTSTSVDREWWLLFPMGFWLVAVTSCSFWVVAFISSRLLGTMRMPRMRMPMLKEKRHLEKWLWTLKYHGISWHTSVMPKFAIPTFAYSQFSPPSRRFLCDRNSPRGQACVPYHTTLDRPISSAWCPAAPAAWGSSWRGPAWQSTWHWTRHTGWTPGSIGGAAK